MELLAPHAWCLGNWPCVLVLLVGVLCTPWLTVAEAAARARCGRKLIFRAVACGKLRAARIDDRRAIRIHVDWLDSWLLAAATPTIVELPRRAS